MTAATLTNGDARAAALAHWRETAAGGVELTGAELGDRFGRSASWGREVVREARSVEPPAAPARSSAPVTPTVRRVTLAAVVVVAAVAAVVSYAHMVELAEAAGEQWRAVMLPLSVDGMMLAASMTALARRRAGQPARLAWLALMLGVLASVAANVAAAQPTVEGRLVAAWPPLALLLAVELALQQTRRAER